MPILFLIGSCADCPFTDKFIFLVLAPAGTVTVNCMAEAAVTSAPTPAPYRVFALQRVIVLPDGIFKPYYIFQLRGHQFPDGGFCPDLGLPHVLP